MKKALTTVLMLVALTFVFGQTILYYWNFNAGSPATDQTWAQPIAATQGNANLTFTTTEAFSFGGTLFNGVDGEVIGGSFAPRGGVDNVNNGSYFTIMASTVGFDNISISYPTRKTGTGFTTQEVKYTTDGTTWISKETVSLSTFANNWVESQMVNVDFNSIPATANNPNFGIRVVLDGCTSASGNNRIDNIRISGALQGGVATPIFDPAGGYFAQPVNVAMTTTTPNATIRYTTNGSEPTETSTLYTTPINITTTTTLKAKGFAAGMVTSVTATATYSFATVVSDLTELRQMPVGDAVYFLPSPAILTWKQSNHKYVQDAGAGIYVYDTAGVIPQAPYEIGDAISGLTGKLVLYFETLEFVPVSNPGPPTSSGNDIVIPTVTVAQLNSDIGINMYQSRLVRINQTHFDAPSGNFPTDASLTYGISDDTGSMSFRTGFWDANYMGTPMPIGTFNMLGIIAHFQSTAQITSRSLADLNAGSANDDEFVTPAGATLIGNYPNPFNPNTNISFSLDKAAPAQVTIYNQKGQTVKSFDMPIAKQGVTTLDWNGTDNSGNSVSSGVYYFRLKSGSYSSTKKMVLMK
ncbi:MAG: chitobiase/beta-hexosaminidase C-terminal domain-containing protein [Candidatus Cloacimonetes bacterium]|nr:chitobiase/beta-hexosaminidase C-terminal domain-containing protein [Candidatus Cloacimonadota bacterium]